jgi:flagellar protein FliJ
MFTYNLQSVLEYRQNIEEKKLTEFSEAERNLQKEKDRLNGIREQQQTLVEELKALKNRECDSRDIALSLKYTEELQKRENRQIEVVQEATAAFEEKRRELLEAVKQRKMMETHKDHQFQDYKADLISAERRESDDISIQRFTRRDQ